MNKSLFYRLSGLNTIATVAAAVFFAQAGLAGAATYYLSSQNGDDTHDGLSVETAWKSLEKVNSMVFHPGDSLLLASDSVFKGKLVPKGSGAMKDGKMVPVVIDRFGEGALPRIDGEGNVRAPLFLHNVEGWEIRNIELTNTGVESQTNRFGVLVLIDEMPVARHFVIRNVTVRDVNGAVPKGDDDTASCAIRLNAQYHDIEGMGVLGRRLDGVLIEDCRIKDCSRNGIIISGMASREQWNPCTGVVVRRNLLEGVGGDGILIIGCDGALVEWNVMRDCPAYGKEGGAAAGMWPWSSDNSIFQFNEVVGHQAWNDATPYDCDFNCNNTLYQYNLSRDNRGGFMLLCSPGIVKKGWRVHNAWNRGSIVRCNLSINDGLRTEGHKPYYSPSISMTGETTQDTQIYSNLIIIPKKPDPKTSTKLVDYGEWGGKYPVNTLLRDNVFVLEPGQPGTFQFAKPKELRFENNRFYGEVEAIVETHQVKSVGNQFIRKTPREVVISGAEEELTKFAGFLAIKGNPQKDADITIDWQVKKVVFTKD